MTETIGDCQFVDMGEIVGNKKDDGSGQKNHVYGKRKMKYFIG